MHPGRLIIASILLVLLALSFLPAQIFVGLYNTVLRPSFVGQYINRIVVRIDDPAVQDEMFGDFVREIIRSQNIRVPPSTYALILDSAVEAIDTYWINIELARNAESILKYFKGGSDRLDLSLNIGAKKDAFFTRFKNGLSYRVLEEMRSEIPRNQQQDIDEEMLRRYVLQEVSSALQSIPDSIDIDAQIDNSTRETLARVRKYFLLYSNLLIFLIPIVLFLPCLRLLPPTAVAPAVGSAIFAAGGSGLLLLLLRGKGWMQQALQALRQALPSEIRPLSEELQPALEQLYRNVFYAALALTVAGALLLGIGIAAAILIRRNRRR